jgi:hypothetical protein
MKNVQEYLHCPNTEKHSMLSRSFITRFREDHQPTLGMSFCGKMDVCTGFRV